MKNYHILKSICRRMFFLGSGNFWYEENVIGDDRSIFYRIYNKVLFLLYGFMTVLEIMAAVMGNFPKEEKRDSITFSVSHTILMMKMLLVIANKSLIKQLNYKMVTVCEKYEDKTLMEEKYRILKMNVAAYFAIVFISTACFVFEGLRKMFAGSHFVTVVTYYPTFEDNSVLATIIRFFATFLLFIMLISMILSVDSLVVVFLITYRYKFITLINYFDNLRKEFERLNNSGEKNLAAETLADGLIEGIEMHKRLLRISKDIDQAVGTVMALQVCQTLGSAVSLMLQIAQSKQLTFVVSVKIIFFVCALFFLLGLYLCNAGEITHQAALVSDAIFYCGWSSCPPRLKSKPGRNIRQLVLLGVMQAQRPLVMKAFKLFELTYGTFLSVVQTTYSVFAVFVS